MGLPIEQIVDLQQIEQRLAPQPFRGFDLLYPVVVDRRPDLCRGENPVRSTHPFQAIADHFLG